MRNNYIPCKRPLVFPINSKTFFMTLQIDIIKKISDFKCGFIKDFWTKNYINFKKYKTQANTDNMGKLLVTLFAFVPAP
jgi:hypothetical protein